MLHHHDASPIPAWQGLLLIGAGLLVLLLSRRIVAWNNMAVPAIHHWQMKLFGLENSIWDTVQENRGLKRWRTVSSWFAVLLTSLLFIVLGVAALLKQPFGTR